MGMWMLAAAAAAKKKQDQRHAAARRARKRREEEERKSKEKRNNSHSDYSENMPSYFECIDEEIGNDAELKDFFQKLYQKVQQVRDEAGAEYRAKAEELVALAEKYNVEKTKIEKKLEESGIEFGERKQLAGIYLSRFTGEYHCSTWGKSRLSLYRETGDSYIYYQAKTINGLERFRITESLLMEDEPKAYLNIAKESLADNQSKYEESKKKLKKLEKRILFISNENKQRKITKLKNEISELENNIRNNQIAIKEHEFVLGLSDEQKADFIKYIQAEKSISDISHEIESLERKFSFVLPKIESKDTILKAMELLEQDGLTEEEITSIFKKLDKVAILRLRGEYESRSWTHNSIDIRMIKEFVKDVYESDPDFVDRNLPDIVSLDEEDRENDGEEHDKSDNNDDPEL